MSGPKISVYSLERERRRLLEAIRNCDRQRTECAVENGQLIADLSELLNDICRNNEKIKNLHHQSENSVKISRTFSEMESTLSAFLQDAVSLQSVNKPSKKGKTILSREELKKHEEALARLKRLNITAKRMDDQIRSQYSVLQMKSISDTRAEILRHTDISRLDFSSPAGKADSELLEIKNRLLSDLEKRTSGRKYSPKMISKLQTIRLSISRASGVSELKNYEMITLKSFYRELESDAAEISRYHILRETYIQTCDEMGISPDPKIPDCGDAAILEKAIRELTDNLIRQDARSYIIDSVDDVMREMGYEVIGTRDVTRKNGRKFHDELYSYSNGTAISVIYSSDGQITMELGGLSHADDLPDPNETELLTDEMNSFCTSFSAIEQKLAERGVLVSNRISMAPPDAEFAMTINLDDYQLKTENIQTLQEAMVHSENRKSSVRKSANKSAME